MDWYSVLSDRAQRSGGESGVDTPVLIPNTEVKHSSGENSWASPCEDSTLPGLYRRSYDLLFLCFLVDWANALPLCPLLWRYYSQQGNEKAREKHDVRISLLILHRVVSFLQL